MYEATGRIKSISHALTITDSNGQPYARRDARSDGKSTNLPEMMIEANAKADECGGQVIVTESYLCAFASYSEDGIPIRVNGDTAQYEFGFKVRDFAEGAASLNSDFSLSVEELIIDEEGDSPVLEPEGEYDYEITARPGKVSLSSYRAK
ncbi:MAG: hypothetical protein KAH23_01745 [Kiritimatiellae bacterium]|nr:hypothetical protein [Kiritimatiellia bacterium]